MSEHAQCGAAPRGASRSRKREGRPDTGAAWKHPKLRMLRDTHRTQRDTRFVIPRTGAPWRRQGHRDRKGRAGGDRELGISGDSVHLGRRDLLEADGAMAAPQGECTYGHRIVPVKMDKRSRRRYVYFSRIRSKGVRGDLGAQAAPGPCGVWKELPARGTLGIVTTGRLTDWGRRGHVPAECRPGRRSRRQPRCSGILWTHGAIFRACGQSRFGLLRKKWLVNGIRLPAKTTRGLVASLPRRAAALGVCPGHGRAAQGAPGGSRAWSRRGHCGPPWCPLRGTVPCRAQLKGILGEYMRPLCAPSGKM